MHVSYPKTLIKLISVQSALYDLTKVLWRACAKVSEAKILNLSPSNTILMGSYLILIVGEKWPICGVW